MCRHVCNTHVVRWCFAISCFVSPTEIAVFGVLRSGLYSALVSGESAPSRSGCVSPPPARPRAGALPSGVPAARRQPRVGPGRQGPESRPDPRLPALDAAFPSGPGICPALTDADSERQGSACTFTAGCLDILEMPLHS